MQERALLGNGVLNNGDGLRLRAMVQLVASMRYLSSNHHAVDNSQTSGAGQRSAMQ